jgi:hypothetical protein
MTRVPWRRSTASLVVFGNVVALAGLVVAWFGAAGEVTVEGQVRWLNLGVAALVVAGVAITAMLREARIRVTDEWRRVLRHVPSPIPIRSADRGTAS